MPFKFRGTATKKNAERKKTHHFVQVRRTGLFSRLKRSLFPTFNNALYITIHTYGLPQEQIDFLKELEAKGLIPKITWIESKPDGLDDKLKLAFLYLHSEEAESMGCKIQKGYDYAWIKIAINSKKMPERYCIYKSMSTPKYVDFIKSLGFTDIAGSKTINKALTHAQWHSDSNKIIFRGVYLSMSERKRRNNIALKFLEIMNEI